MAYKVYYEEFKKTVHDTVKEILDIEIIPNIVIYLNTEKK